MGFNQRHSGELGDIPGFIQLLLSSYKNDKPNNITGFDNVQMNYDCYDSSVANGIREPILNTFALSSPSGHKIYKEAKIKLFKKVNKICAVSYYLLFRR